MEANIHTNYTKNTRNSDFPQQSGLFQPLSPLKPLAEKLHPFPVDCFPSKIRRYVEAVAVHTQTPADMAAGVALGVLAACLQGKVRVEGNPGHYEQTSLYVFLIAPPGSRKSAVIHEMTEPIEDYEQDYNERMKPEIRRTRQKRESYQRDMNRLTKQLEAKYDKMTELELQHTQDLLADLPDLRPLQIFTDDCTSESMIRLLRENGGRMSLISAEGGAFDNIVGRYTRRPNLDVWLKGICGDTIRVDRINREPDYIRNPALSMIISAQPTVLSEVMRDRMLDGRGFLARLFYINVTVPSMHRSFQSSPIPPEVKTEYRNLVYSLLDRPADQLVTLRLTPDAVERMDRFCRDLETFLQRDHRDMREWGSKFTGLVLRIAGLLQTVYSEETSIGLNIIECAIRIGSYALEQAMFAYTVIDTDETIEKAMHVVSRMKKARITQISRADLYQKCRGRFFRNVKELDPVLELLEQHGYIRTELIPYNGIGRPPGSLIRINPLVMEEA